MKIEGKEYRTIWFDEENTSCKDYRSNETSSSIYNKRS